MMTDRFTVHIIRRTLLDSTGRLWVRNPTPAGQLGNTPDMYCHHGHVRTERQIEDEAEPIIEVHDPRVLVTPLEPVLPEDIRLNDLVVLPGYGALSPVIGVWPLPDPYTPRLYICTENGDWARRTEHSPVLRAVLRPVSSGCRWQR
jgi:hypothetical protein